MAGEIFTLDADNNAAVRTVSVNAGASETNSPVIFTKDANGNAAVRVVAVSSVADQNVVIVSKTMPAASAEVYGQVHIYTGATGATFTRGYIYECVGTIIYTDTVSFEPATVSGTFVTASAGSLSNLAAQYISGDVSSIVSGTMTFDEAGDLWRFTGKDANGNTVGTFQLYTEDYRDAGFTFTGTPENGDVVDFTCTIEVSSATYSWQRLEP